MIRWVSGVMGKGLGNASDLSGAEQASVTVSDQSAVRLEVSDHELVP